jgi:hypothetical protein
MPFAHRILRIAWLVSVAAAPRRLSSRLLAFRFIVGQRPMWVEWMLGIVSINGRRGGSSPSGADPVPIHGTNLTKISHPSGYIGPSRFRK